MIQIETEYEIFKFVMKSSIPNYFMILKYQASPSKNIKTKTFDPSHINKSKKSLYNFPNFHYL